MYFKLILVFVIVVNNLCSGESLDARTRPKRLMPIDVSKLSSDSKSVYGTSLYKPLAIVGHNHVGGKSVSKPLSIDLSALKQLDVKTTTVAPDFKSLASEESKDYWSDVNDMDSGNKAEDFEEYDYPQAMRIVPHNVYFHVWSPETPGFDALTDFLHEEYKTDRILSNGKRDNELFAAMESIDNEIPVFPDWPPAKGRPSLCSYRLLKAYDISCSQLMRLIGPQTDRQFGNHVFKRNMFLSKGWGPSGSYINLPSKFKSNTIVSKINLKLFNNLAAADHQILPEAEARPIDRTDNKQAINSRRWSVPHLFGSY